MNDNGIVFNQNAKIMAFDNEHYELMMSHYQRFIHNLENCTNYYSDLDLERQRALNIRNRAFKKLDKLLVDFDTNFTNKGGKILWANDADDAKQMIYNILCDEKVKNIVKTRSSTLEEIGLNSYLELKKIKFTETNIGDFVSCLYNQVPYNIINSAYNKTTLQVANIYSEKYGVKEDCDARQLTNITKYLLSNDIKNSQALISGANFLISNTGTVVLTESEGNILKSSTFAPIHIIVAGIDKLITSIDELSVLLPLSSFYEPRRNLSPLYNFINKPLKIDDNKQQKLYLIFLDNNRTNVLAKEKQRNILSCVHCGACSRVCPIYNTIGGHVYETNHPGPVGSIVYPLTKGMESASHFTSLCTSCGRCEEVCPVNIPLKDLFLENRMDLVNEDKSLIGERNFLSYMVKRMSSRKNLEKYSFSKDMELSFYVKKKWGTRRELPKFAKESFSEYWRNINNLK